MSIIKQNVENWHKLNLCVSLKPIFWERGNYIKMQIPATKPGLLSATQKLKQIVGYDLLALDELVLSSYQNIYQMIFSQQSQNDMSINQQL